MFCEPTAVAPPSGKGLACHAHCLSPLRAPVCLARAYPLLFSGTIWLRLSMSSQLQTPVALTRGATSAS